MGILLVFWDSGSNVSMVTKEFTRKAGWKGTWTTTPLQSTNLEPEKWNNVAYQVILVDLSGKEHNILPFEIEQMTGDIDPLYISHDITKLFGGACDTVDISRPNRQLDILIGIHCADLHLVVADLQ